MKPPKNFNQWMGFEPEFSPNPVSDFEMSNIQSALNRGSFMRMPSNGSVPTSTKKIGWGGVLSAGLGMVGNIVSTAMTNRANREMQREANEQNERLWREQMEYNSPASQMARFKQAGLNPNLAYGDNGNAGVPLEYRSSKNEAPQVDPMAFANAMLLQKQINLADAERANIEADTKNKLSDANLKDTQAVGFSLNNKVFWQRFEAEQSKLFSEINLTEAEVSKLFKEGQFIYEKTISQKLENYFNSETMSARIDAVLKQNKLTDEQIKVAKATASKMYAEISFLKKQGELITEQKFKTIAETAYINSRKDLTEYEKEQIRSSSNVNNAMAGYYKSLEDKTDVETSLSRQKFEMNKSDLEFTQWIRGQDGGFLSSVIAAMNGACYITGQLF